MCIVLKTKKSSQYGFLYVCSHNFYLLTNLLIVKCFFDYSCGIVDSSIRAFWSFARAGTESHKEAPVIMPICLQMCYCITFTQVCSKEELLKPKSYCLISTLLSYVTWSTFKEWNILKHIQYWSIYCMQLLSQFNYLLLLLLLLFGKFCF